MRIRLERKAPIIWNIGGGRSSRRQARGDRQQAKMQMEKKKTSKAQDDISHNIS
tara:strand:+ start:333 stop:494 length:162 start_codon:yes stop_codon:yes gene_type:complete